MPRFINHPIFGTADTFFATAGERIEVALTDGLPDEELTAPISAWGSCRVAEFGGPLAGLLAEKEGA